MGGARGVSGTASSGLAGRGSNQRLAPSNPAPMITSAQPCAQELDIHAPSAELAATPAITTPAAANPALPMWSPAVAARDAAALPL